MFTTKVKPLMKDFPKSIISRKVIIRLNGVQSSSRSFLEDGDSFIVAQATNNRYFRESYS